MRITFLLLSGLVFTACSDLSSDQQKLVETLDRQVHHHDLMRRISIIEDDFVEDGVSYKLRAYLSDDELIKIVGVTTSPHFERDDYFYFNHDGDLIFTGHLINDRDHHIAREFKYYYKDGEVALPLHWEGEYDPKKPFPKEVFTPFQLNMDSLNNEEKSRLAFFMDKIQTEGFLIKAQNDNIVSE
ncbi:MAG: hypothetical protein RJQ09_16015 [Cyclobacteriaceae bacterium]